MNQQRDFELALRAFDSMTTVERYAVLGEFAQLRYPSMVGRFFEAVHLVIRRNTEIRAHVREMSGCDDEA